ncbi:hypothetical protein YC2023_108567 [Brassica napus]
MTSVAVRVCPSEHTGRPWLSLSTHISTLVLRLSTLALPLDCLGDFVPRWLSVQYTQDVRGCPPANTGRPWLFVAVRQHTQDVCVCPCVSVSTHRTFVGVGQHTQDVRVCPTHRTSVGVRQHTQDVRGGPCVSVSTQRTSVAVHQYTYQHAGPWTQHAGPSCGLFGDFGPRGLSVQYTQDVGGCPSAHTERPCVSVSTHRTFVAVCVCPCVSVSTHMTSVAVHHTHRTSVAVRVCPSLSVSTHRTSVAVPHTHRTSMGVRQHTQDVRGCLWLSVSTHRTSVCVCQHTQDVRGCRSAHTGRSCVSVSIHRTSVAVHVCPSAHTGRLWLSISTHISTLVLGLCTLALPVDCLGDFGPRGLSVQYTQDVRGCPPAHTGRPWRTLVLGLSTLALPVDCLGDFGPRGLSVQYTQDVCGCPSANTGRPCVSVSTHRTFVAVRVCPFVSVSTHMTSVAVHQYTYQHVGPLTPHADPSCGLFGMSMAVRVFPSVSVSTHRTSVAVPQYTYQHVVHKGRPWVYASTHRTSVAVCGCPSAHTGCPCVSVSIHRTSVAVRVCPSAHTGRSLLSISTHISTLVLGLCTLALPVDCLGDFGPRGLSVQYTQDVRGCPPAHTGRLWLSLCIRVCPSAHTGRPWLSISTHISTLVLGLSMLTLPVDCSGDIRPRGLSVQYTQDVRGCPSAHTGRPCVSVSTHRTFVAGRVCPFVSVSTHMTSVAVHQYTYQHVGPLTSHADPSCGLFGMSTAVRVCPSVSVSTHRTSVAVPQYTYQHVVHTGRPWVYASTRRTSVAVCGCPSAHTGCPCVSVCVCQHTQDVGGCPSAHTGRPCVSVSIHRTSMAVRVCPSAHTGRSLLSISTHISTLVLGLCTLALPVDCLGDFGPRGLSVQYTQDVRGTSVAVHQYTYQHVGPWTQHAYPSRGLFGTHRTSVGLRQHTQDVRCCPCVSVSTYGTSVAVPQYTYQNVGPSTQHAGPSCGLFGTSVAVCGCLSAHTGRLRVSVCVCQHTQDVRGCPSAHTGRLCVSVSIHRTSVAVRVCPSAHTGRSWLSISTHISTLVLGLYTLALPVDCLGDFGPRGLSVQYTQDIRGCPPAHKGRPWLFVAVSQHTQDVRVCLCVSVSTHRTSVGVRQHTQDVRVCPSAYTGRLWLSVSVHQHTQDVRGCPSVHISAHWSLDSARWPFPWTVWVILAHVCYLFSTHRMSVGVRQHSQDVRGCPFVSVCVRQHTQDVRGCPSVHISARCTHRTSVGLRHHTQDVRGCPCVSVSTHGTSVAVPQYTYQNVVHTGRPWVSASTHRTSHTQDVRGCPSAHIAHPCVSVSIHRTSVAVRVCPSAHTERSWLSISTHISTLVLGLCTLALPVDCLGDFGRRGQSVQYTQDVRGCPPAHTGHPCVFVCVCFCPSAHTGRPWLSISTHISTLVLGLSTLTLPVDCSGDLSPRGLSVQYTQDVRGCPSAHTGRLCVSVSTHRTFVAVRVCLCVSVSTHMTSVAVHKYTYQHVGPLTPHADPSCGLFG